MDVPEVLQNPSSIPCQKLSDRINRINKILLGWFSPSNDYPEDPVNPV
jgi:hypothetical protein